MSMLQKNVFETEALSDLVLPREEISKIRRMTTWRLSFAAQLSEVVLISIIGVLLYGVLNKDSFMGVPSYFSVSVLVAVIAHFSFARADLYVVDLLFDEIAAMRVLLARWTVIFLGLAAFAALTHLQDRYSRLWFVGFYFGGAASLMASRTLFGVVLRRAVRRGFVTRSVVVYGDNGIAGRLMARLADNRSGARIVGVFDDSVTSDVAGEKTLVGLKALLEFVKHHRVDMVVISSPLNESESIDTAIRALRLLPLDIRVLPGLIGLDHISPLRTLRSELPGVHLIPVANRPISEVALWVKGSIDRAVSGFALLEVVGFV